MITTLSQASALNPGAELWVMTDLKKSHWTAKIDWYLNFQIVKASRHSPPGLSDFLIQMIEKTELKIPSFELLSQAPLLIHSQPLLPNKWVAVVPYTDNFKHWMKNISEIWNQLQNPSLRIFLPAGQLSSAVTDKMISSKEIKEITVVLDLSN